jgi:hypothetical protein
MPAWPRLVDPGRARVLPPTTWTGRLDEDMATRKRHNLEQVVRKLATADRTPWKARTSPTCRELENATHKRLLADAELEGRVPGSV